MAHLSSGSLKITLALYAITTHNSGLVMSARPMYSLSQ